MKKIIGIMIGALVVALMVTNYVGAKEKIKIVWMEYEAKYNTVYRDMAKDFQVANPNIAVETITLPWEGGHDRLLTWIAGGQAPDIANVATRWILEFHDVGVVEPLSRHFGKEFIKGFVEPSLEARIKGVLYGLPVAMSARTLYYRPDIVGTPPKTWDELLAIAKEVNNPPKVYGIGIAGKKSTELVDFEYFLFGNDGYFFAINPDGSYGKCIVNNTAGVEALQFYLDLINKYKVTQPGVNTYTEEDIEDLFMTGKLAMAFSGPWLKPILEERAPNISVAVAPIPPKRGKPQRTLMVTDSLIMFKSSKHKKEAAKFLEFIYQDKYRLAFNKAFGMLPVRKSVGDMSYFQTPYYKVYIEQLARAKAYPLIKEWPKCNDILWNKIGAAILGIKTAKKALDEAALAIDRLRGQ